MALHPDDIVARIFAFQQERAPDTDPGDLAMTIEVQDDMPLVTVRQQGMVAEGASFAQRLSPLGMGGSIQEALEAAARTVGISLDV